jgi:hypothetical protein
MHSIWHAPLHAAAKRNNCLGYSFIDISSTSVRLSIVKFRLFAAAGAERLAAPSTFSYYHSIHSAKPVAAGPWDEPVS